MSCRPRPVTATVTKPRWMQIPDPETREKFRHQSFNSDESLNLILEKVNSYGSDNETETDMGKKDFNSEESLNKTYSADTVHIDEREERSEDQNDEKANSDVSPTKSLSTQSIESRLSAWEQWIVHKAKENQIKRREENHKKKEEEAKKQREEQEKQIRLKKAEVVRQQWTEEKNKQFIINRKQERIKKRNEKLAKEEIENQIKQKANEKYALWSQMKKKEDLERRRKIKEEAQKIQEHEETRRSMAEAKFNEWLKQAAGRPRSAPNSFGYLSGKMTGYHDRSAYPTPSFVNPKPWATVAVPLQDKVQVRSKKAKVKPYKWNPEKYF